MKIINLIISFIAGAFSTLYYIMITARKNFVTEQESNYDFDETVERVKKVVNDSNGWVLPIPSWQFSQVMEKKGKAFEGIERLDVFFICNAEYAQKMVSNRPAMASLMPCGWAIYIKNNGKVFLGALNAGLLSMPFSGLEREIFKKVEKDVVKMQKSIVD